MDFPAEPKTREEFLKCSCLLTLDPNTVNEHLRLSEGNKKVKQYEEAQSCPAHPDRFTEYYQVLCREALSGACYWEVEWSGGCVNIAVSYKGISRKGDKVKCWLGGSEHSWSLVCIGTTIGSVFHNLNEELVPEPCSRVGVYLDHRAGTLAFYNVSESDTMTLLHRVQTTFTEPLYPAFLIGDGSSLSILTSTQ